MIDNKAAPSAQCTDVEPAVPQPRALPWLVLIGLVYAAALIAMLPYCRYQINPDGMSYMRIAQYWAVGDVRHAVNGYWSPLLSWCLVPFVWSGLICCGRANGHGTAGLALALATYGLARRLGLSRQLRLSHRRLPRPWGSSTPPHS